MEEIIMKKNKYVIPSVEVVSLFVEQDVMLSTSDNTDTEEQWTKKRRPTTTSSNSIWNNNQND